MSEIDINNHTIRIGTAGWSIPKRSIAEFSSEGTHLQRYARRLTAVEINSSFYRSHRPETYARWATGVPSGFRFAVKMPRQITHVRKLCEVQHLLDGFLSEVRALGDTLGPLLVQLPPAFRFDQAVAETFLDDLRTRFDGAVACEPRHPSWFTNTAEAMLVRFQIARAAADPAPVPQAALPGGWPGLIYRRLHGSPHMYYSAYTADYLDMIARQVRAETATGQQNWCIFDNTALGEAMHDAFGLLARIVQCRPH